MQAASSVSDMIMSKLINAIRSPQYVINKSLFNSFEGIKPGVKIIFSSFKSTRTEGEQWFDIQKDGNRLKAT